MTSRCRSAWRSSVVAVLLLATTGCADPDFMANGEDARRLDILRTDEMYGYLAGRTTCQESVARYVPSNGLPLDFAGIETNRVRCQLANEETAGLVDAAEAAGWTPTIDLSTFEFRKELDGLWASMSLGTGSTSMTVTLALPEHTREEDAPSPSQIAAGEACLDAVRAKAPPTPGCSLAR